MPIPPGTAIPSWAWQDVAATDSFNVTLAQQVAAERQPDSTAPGAPASTSPSSSSSADASSTPPPTPSPSSTPTPTPTPTPSSKKSNVGPIVGGVVGGVGGIVIIIGAIWFFMRQRQTSHRPPSAAFAPGYPQQQPPVEPAPWTPGDHEKQFMTPTPPVPEFPTAKIYVRYIIFGLDSGSILTCSCRIPTTRRPSRPLKQCLIPLQPLHATQATISACPRQPSSPRATMASRSCNILCFLASGAWDNTSISLSAMLFERFRPEATSSHFAGVYTHTILLLPGR